MPYFCRSLISQALNHGANKSVSGLEDPDHRRRVQARHRRLARDAGREADSAAAHRRRDGRLPRPVRPGVRRHDARSPLEPEAYDCVAIVTNHSHDRLRRPRAPRQGDRRLPQRHEGPRGRRQGLEAVTRVAVAGLGYWGPNLVRNFDDLAELAWLVDVDPELRERFAAPVSRTRRSPPTSTRRSPTTRVDAVVVATPVPTHYALAKRALEAGKHVLVEKPPAMHAVEMDELVALAAERDRVLMPGHLLLYHPGVLKLKELIDAGELGEVLCVYGNRQNLGIVRTNENALWSLGVHDLSVILYLLDEDPRGRRRTRPRLPHTRRRGRRLLLPALPQRQDRAHAPLLARPAQDAQDDRRRPREDGGVRRHGARAQGDDLREVAVEARRDLRRVADALRRHLDPEDLDRRSLCASSARTSSSSSQGSTIAARSHATAPASCARSRCSPTRSHG